MANFISLLFSLLIFGLVVQWILSFIDPRQYSQIEKIRIFLDKIYGPFLDLIRNKIKPIIKLRNGNSLDLSPAILFVILAICRKVCFLIF